MNGMFSGCSNLETLCVSSFDISKSEDVENMFCSCEKLNDIDKKSFRRTSFKCVKCETPNPFLIEYSNQCVANCSDTTNYKYLLEEEKICVEDCKETDHKFFIDGEFKCIANCDESLYLIEDNKCIKKEEEKDEEKKDEEKENSKEKEN